MPMASILNRLRSPFLQAGVPAGSRSREAGRHNGAGWPAPDRRSQPGKPRLALVTTWQETCGIAHYAYFLKRALDPYFDITVLPLPGDILRGHRSEADRRRADAHCSLLAGRMSEFDYVNFQFEIGLFGDTDAIATARFGYLLGAAGRSLVTFHTVDTRHWQQARGLRRPDLARVLSQKARTGQLSAIAHTPRHAADLRQMLPGTKVFDTPLTFLDADYRAQLDEFAGRSRLHEVLPEPDGPQTRYVGVFGFFGPYKGLETAIGAMTFLPDQYELLMFCSVHPNEVRSGAPPNATIPALLKLIRRLDASREAGRRALSDRVHFIGAVGDDDLILGMRLCDAVMLPYRNSGPSASGPAALAIELDRKVFASRVPTFIDLAAYRPESLTLCDVGNEAEFALKIKALATGGTDRMVHGYRVVDYPRRPQAHDAETTALCYRRALGMAGPV